MILKPTVLVLGAGASSSYGYPLQVEFKKAILNKLQDNEMRSVLIQVYGYSEFIIDNFYSAFQLSGLKCIEDFLSQRKDYEEIGKLLIAQVIKEYNNFEILFKDELWYTYLFNKMNDSFDKFGNNKLSVITFNFDISLEVFFFNALRSSYGKSDQEIFKQLSQISILHINGYVGDLTQQLSMKIVDSKKNRPQDLSKSDIRELSINKKETDYAMEKARFMLQQAEVICFLGFGYDDFNMERLRVIELEKKVVTGSVFGLKSGEIKSIVKKTNSKLVLGKTKVAQSLDVKGFLKESGILEL